MTALLDELTPDVRAFCQREGVEQYLRLAVELAHEYFPDAHSVSAEVVFDPDAGEEWVMLNVRLPAGVTDLLARDHRFVERWITDVPWPERDKVVVMLYPA